MSLEIIILAAGQGTRMRSTKPKVLHHLAGKPLLQHVVETAAELSPDTIHVVIGHESALVRETLESCLCSNQAAKIRWVLQREQKGTGHAVSMAASAVSDQSRCLILYGDVPLVDLQSLRLLESCEAEFGVLTTEVENPASLGRIIRDQNNPGYIARIVERKDATEEELQISEINTGIMICQAVRLKGWLSRLDNNNNSAELYLTDIAALAANDDCPGQALITENPATLQGVNSCADLAFAERILQRQLAEKLMLQGVTLTDPGRFDLRGEVSFGDGCVVDINVVIEGNNTIGNNVIIGPNCVIRDCVIGNGCRIDANCILEHANLAADCNIGPFARLRPQTILDEGVRIGNFVEVKKSKLDKGAKANHLAYVGDSIVGKNVNIGAGVITCNYDGANKHQTIIGDDVFVGSDSQLVAPVTIADGATIGAGTTLTKNVERDALVFSRAPQKSVAAWKRPTKKQS